MVDIQSKTAEIRREEKKKERKKKEETTGRKYIITRQRVLFSHRRSPSPPDGTQWYRLLLRVACCVYGLATAHSILCIVKGDDSAVFRFFLFLVTLTFDLDLRTGAKIFCTMYLTAKFDRPVFSRSEVTVRTN